MQFDWPGQSFYRVMMGGITCGVVTHYGNVANCAPILSRFINQPIDNLIFWVESKGGKVERLR